MDALNPAMERWKRVVLGDRRWTMLLKLGFVALIAEISGGGGGSFSYSRPSDSWPHAGATSTTYSGALTPLILAIIVAAVLVGVIVGMVILYLSCRMKFVEFQVAVTGQRSFAQPWRAYGRQGWRLFWSSLVIWLVCLALIAAIAAPMVFAFLRHHGAISPGMVLGIVLLVLPPVIAVLLMAALAFLVVRDLMVPPMALQDATISQAWAVARSIMEASYKSFAAYVLVKIGIRIVTAIAAGVAMFFCVLVSAIPFGIVAALIYFALHNGSRAGMIGCFILEGTVALVWLVILIALTQGLAFWFSQCYAIEWVAGRYPPLASVMVRLGPPVMPMVPPLPAAAPVEPA